MTMTPERWESLGQYLGEVFGEQDATLAKLARDALQAGLPDISVGPQVGRLLMILTSLTGGGRGARLALEIGTLGGYSAMWIARGLAPGGKLITVEPDRRHADFAAAALGRAGLASQIEVRRQEGLSALSDIAAHGGHEALDLVFLDATKIEYPQYFAAARPLIAPGGLLVADNVLGTRSVSVVDPPGSSADRDAIDAFNREVATDPAFDAVAFPLREAGLLVARKR